MPAQPYNADAQPPSPPEVQPGRFLHRTSERSFEVHDDGTIKGTVWCAAADLAEGKRWRASDPSGTAEWRPWLFFPSPQDAARYCVAEYDRRVR